MSIDRRRGFDLIGPPTDATLRVLVGPTAIAEASDDLLKLLATASALPFLQIIFVEPKDSRRELLVEHGALVGKVNAVNSNYVLTHAKGSSLLHPVEFGDQRARKHDTAVANGWIDRLLVNSADYFDLVVASEASLAAFSPGALFFRLCGTREFLRRARLFGVGARKFMPVPNYTVNEGFYYLFRLYHHFPAVQRAWVCVATTKPAGRELLSDQIGSLRGRLEMFDRASDETCLECLRSPNNDTDSRTLYSLAYQFLLAAAAVESLAWIIRYVHKIEDLSRLEITLRRKWKTKSHSQLTNRLQNLNPDLHKFLQTVPARGCIDSIFEIRDQLQHRELPTTIGIAAGSDLTAQPSVIRLPLEPIKALSDATGQPIPTDAFPPDMEGVSVDPYLLSIVLTDGVRALVNDVLGHLPWEEMITAAAPKQQGTIRGHFDRLTKGVGAYLGWGVEPLLFQY